MSSFPRRFLRLNEIAQKTTLTQGDVFEAIEENKLSLYAFINGKALGAFQMREKKKVIRAIFDYQGVVSLTPNDANKFVTVMKEYDVTYLGIHEPSKVSSWRSVSEVYQNIRKSFYTFTPQCPNQPEKAFWAFAATSATPTIENFLSPFLSQMEEDEKFRQKMDGTSEIFNKQMRDAQRLNTSNITIMPEQLRVDMNQLVELYGDVSKKDKALPNDHIDEPNIDVEVLLSHPIEKIVCRILKSSSDLKAPQVWSVMKEDARLEESRKFDLDCILDDIGKEKLIWLDSDGNERSLSYNTFRKKHLVEVRNNLKQGR